MDNDSPIIGVRAIRHRTSGLIVTEPTPIYESDWPYAKLQPNQLLLRYMDFYKFKDLFETQSLYFSRVDKFTDHLEGTLSAEGIHGTSPSDIAFAGKAGIRQETYRQLAAQQEVKKACTFVNCWHINDRETMQMWAAYTKSADSVLIISTVEKLAASLRAPVVQSCVKYLGPETPRTQFDERSAFFYKDKGQFSFENEYRLLIDLGMIPGPIYKDAPKDSFRRVPVELSKLIFGINPHPLATEQTIAKIDGLVRQYLPSAIKQLAF